MFGQLEEYGHGGKEAVVVMIMEVSLAVSAKIMNQDGSCVA